MHGLVLVFPTAINLVSGTLSRHFVGTSGFLEMGIPFLDIDGRHKQKLPLLAVVAGMHGEETSSLIVIHELLQKIPAKFKGTLRIVFSANPLSLVEHDRWNNVDCLDMNRIFPGNVSGTITHRLANSLVELVKDADAVIDLHAFKMRTPRMAICIVSGNPELDEKNLELARELSSKQIWLLSAKNEEENRFHSSFGPILNKISIPNVAIELDAAEVVSEEDIRWCAEAIVNVMDSQGMLEESGEGTAKPKKEHNCGIFKRTVLTAQSEGVFIPEAPLLSNLKKGQLIGKIVSLPSLEEQEVVAREECILMQILHKDFVNLGQEIAATGVTTEAAAGIGFQAAC